MTVPRETDGLEHSQWKLTREEKAVGRNSLTASQASRQELLRAKALLLARAGSQRPLPASSSKTPKP